MKKPIFIILFVLFCFLLAIGSGFYAYLTSFKPDPEKEKEIEKETDPIKSPHERINVLVLGLDAGVIGVQESRNHKRSDTMFVVSIDTNDKKVNVLSIPRDSRVNIQGRGIDKINAAHAYGGPELAIKTVKDLLDIPIHYYVKVDYEGFKQIVDALGGVEIYVERSMHYDDYAQDLHIHLNKGLQLLNGEKALEFVRYRHYPNGDIGRIAAQQKFMSALAKKVLQPGTVLKLPRIAAILPNYVETNMDPGEIVKYADMARHIDYNNIKMDTLPGVDEYINGISYWIIDKSGMKEMVDDLLRDIDSLNSDIRIQVLNGTGEVGLANRVAQDLKKEGFNVVGTGNADKFDYENTVVIYRDGNIEQAKKIALLVGGSELVQKDFMDADADILIILGRK
ncbi:MAG: polyisoprenyl-teichoic acid--peptidoglycan teichoic acid transferase [Thermosediminibacterales bacterium]|nr:polyisoprenyl-teichoic acid--peptidoglycan teichoic acid transferase [Thermosediminibacterales bacterium]